MIDVEQYWDNRYDRGGNSGAGSRGAAATYKARMVNSYIEEHNIKSLIDLGCGDGYIAQQIQVDEYLGLDISASALEIAKERCRNDHSKVFAKLNLDSAYNKADAVLSMDVILHLVPDELFIDYMNTAFGLARRAVILYTTNGLSNSRSAPHVKHRPVTDWIEQNIDGWEQTGFHQSPIPDGISAADFYIYTRTDDG